MTDRERLIEIVKAVSFQYSEEPVFRLTSGALSSMYFNMKKTTMSAEGMHLSAHSSSKRSENWA